MGGLIPSAKFFTVLLLLINSGLYAATVVYSMNSGNTFALTNVDGRTLAAFGAKGSWMMVTKQYWRLVTAGFLHGGILHFLMNTWVLMDLGARVEEAFGIARMIPIYFAATVLGFYASWLYTPGSLSVGASAGLFGLLGAMIAFGMQHRSAIGQAIKQHYVRWTIYGLAMGLIIPHIDNAAHLGGLAGGFGVAYLSGQPSLRPEREHFWKVAATLCVILTAYSFFQMARSFTLVFSY